MAESRPKTISATRGDRLGSFMGCASSPDRRSIMPHPSLRHMWRGVLLLLALAVLALAPAVAAANPAGTLHAPDIRTVIPATDFSIAGTGTTREFRYTHLVYNAGPGPLEIQP